MTCVLQDVNNTALMVAVSCAHGFSAFEKVQALLECAGLDVNAQNKVGMMCYH